MGITDLSQNLFPLLLSFVFLGFGASFFGKNIASSSEGLLYREGVAIAISVFSIDRQCFYDNYGQFCASYVGP